MKHWIAVLAAATAMLAPLAGAQAQPKDQRPTIVLVHGAFAESGSWNGVLEQLRRGGYTVIAASNPLRDVASDIVMKSNPNAVAVLIEAAATAQ